jgi:ABC-type glycerol-3-phosphate transport system substrate-binding protein
VRRLVLLAGAALAGLAACSGGERWSYTTPAVVDEAALLAQLVPARPGELVLANFWASW